LAARLSAREAASLAASLATRLSPADAASLVASLAPGEPEPRG
jgi:hypothetical protein